MEKKAHSPSPEEIRRSNSSLLLAIFAVAVPAIGSGIMVASRGRFIRLFEEMEVSLSSVSQIALNPLLPALLVLIALATLGKELLIGAQSVRNTWNVIVILLAATMLAFYIVGVSGPLFSMIQSLS